jgi:hypothetical protein
MIQVVAIFAEAVCENDFGQVLPLRLFVLYLSK